MNEWCRIFSWFKRLFFHHNVFVPFESCWRVSFPLVCSDGTSGLNHIFDSLSQRYGSCVRNDFNSYSSKSNLAFVFNCNKSKHFAMCATTSFSWLNSANKYFVDFHEPTQEFTTGADHTSANDAQKIPASRLMFDTHGAGES